MLEAMVLGLFVAMLVVGIVFGLPLVLTLLVGWLLFFDYGLLRGFDMRELAVMSLRGVRSCGSVLLLFAIIGALTASWRAAGTIPAITCLSARFLGPSTLVLATFLLCSAMSLLTGSSFATAATTGVICMSVARALGANVVPVGGAVLSGCFVGDRCSPISSSAALVASLTSSELLDNVRRMVRTGIAPFVLCCALYALVGGVSNALTPAHAPSFGKSVALMGATAPSGSSSMATALSASFDLSPVVLIPVAVVVVLSLARVSVPLTMLASLAVSLVLCVRVQGVAPAELPHILIEGYTCANASVARIASGGGVLSMAEIACIVGIAATYSGIFEETGLLAGLRDFAHDLARRSTPFVCVLICGMGACVVACDQVVALMLTHQLCDGIEHGGSALALDLENSVAVIPALIPWSTSCVGIAAFVGMPVRSIAFAFFPVLVPLWTLGISLWVQRHPEFVDGNAARALGLTREDDARRWATQA